jgi:toxin ParE1/3/4
MAQSSVDAARRFYRAIQQAILFLMENPEAGGVQETTQAEYAGMRVWQVPGFRNHLIYYRATADSIEVFRLIHAARDRTNLF